MTAAVRPALPQLHLLILLPVIWALHFAFIKKIGADTDALAALTALLAALCALYFGVLTLKRQLFVFTRSRLIFFLVAGVLAYVVPLGVEMLAAPKIDATVLTMIVSLTPVFTVAVAMGLRLIRPAMRLILSVVVGTTGILLLLLESNTSVESPTIWIIIACLVPMAYAVDALYVEHFWPPGLNALQVAFGESFVSLLILLTLTLLTGVSGAAIGGWFLQTDFLILCVVTAIEVVLFFYLVSTVGAVTVNVASFLVLPAGFFWGWLIFDEVITAAGFGCVICAVTALHLAKRNAEE
ncbi:MAG: DMT family transporter [Proteobacteria bacterium]|nr:DMT family transporter [Pseudomonadota bacterium]MDA0845819.1 DMT family transporter [Pseudomonadota bacterium]